MTAFLNVTEASTIKEFDGTRRAINVDKIVGYYPNSKGSTYLGATVLVVECGSETELVNVYEDIISIEKLFRQWNLKLNPWKPGAKLAWQTKSVKTQEATQADSQEPFSVFENKEE